MVTVAVSGYFNPVHIGHIRLFEEAKKLGDRLIVIVNNDHQVALKGNHRFMKEKERMEIVASLKPVDNVILAVDEDKTVAKTLELIKPDIFANGGDRKPDDDDVPVPEYEICDKLGIKMVFNIGGDKAQSSSDLVKKAKDLKK